MADKLKKPPAKNQVDPLANMDNTRREVNGLQDNSTNVSIAQSDQANVNVYSLNIDTSLTDVTFNNLSVISIKLPIVSTHTESPNTSKRPLELVDRAGCVYNIITIQYSR